jgi:DsbC/DsbD-like thiol-disulfide interchange protein
MMPLPGTAHCQDSRSGTKNRAMRSVFLLSALACLVANAAQASSSSWHKAEGARLRLVTTGAPDAAGKLSGALEIQLKPNWKTYWRDPGSSGVPPNIDVSKSATVASVDIRYPAPARFNDASGAWVGYKHSVTLPITFQLSAAGAIDAEIFIGLCEEICVPLQASLSVDPGSDPANEDDKAAVEAGLARLPALAGEKDGATLVAGTQTELVVAAPEGAKPDETELFIAGVDGYVLGVPEKRTLGHHVTFSYPLLERPATRPAGKGFPYTLVTADRAVDGYVPYP